MSKDTHHPGSPDNDIAAADVLRDSGALDAAIDAYRKIIGQAPDLALAHYKLGTAYMRQKKADDAEACFRQAIQLRPRYPEAENNLGIILAERGESADAETLYRNALAADIDYFEAHYNLGNLLRVGTRRAEGLYHYQRAIELQPDSALAKERLGSLMYDLGMLTEAKAMLQQATLAKPELAAAWINLARCHHALQELDDAEACSRRAIPLDPHQMAPWHNLLLSSNWRTDDKAETFKLHLRFGDHLADTLEIEPDREFRNVPRPERRLRIGFVSGDLRRHSVSYFVEGLLTHLDRKHFEAWAYYNHPLTDYRSAELKPQFAEWRNIFGMADAEAAQMIRRDGIDILVDLSGHTGHSRLDIFAHKPAPIQVSWIGYPNTTGLKTIDYRITDALTDPPGISEEFHCETLVRLPDCFLCYTPPREAPLVSPLPLHAEGRITFGSFNARVKISDQILALWSRILLAVDNSRLIVKSVAGINDDIGRTQLLDQMQRAGIDPACVVLMPPEAAIEDHLATYGKVDIALDTFPYNGTTTTCEALWMGVAVVTFAGDRHGARVGASLLSNVGLPELVANTTDEYVVIAVALARDHDRLARLRTSMRQRMLASPLLNAESSTRHVERALRQMWLAFCDRNAGESPRPLPDDERLEVRVEGGIQVSVSADALHDRTAWVLLEQEDWCEDDQAFLRGICRPTWHALDVGAHHGIYSLALAAAGARQVWAFAAASGPRLKLRDSIALNHFDARIQVLPFGLSDSAKTLDLALSANGDVNSLRGASDPVAGHETVDLAPLDPVLSSLLPDVRIDFVKLGAESEAAAVLRGGLRFFLEQSPLVLFECRHASTAFDLELVATLRAMGYGIYRLVPGLSCLVPVPPEQEAALDGFCVILYACKEDRANALAADGRLARKSVVGQIDLKPEWRATLFSLPALASFAREHWNHFDFGTDYGNAVLAWCGSRHSGLGPESRFQLLNQALQHLETAANGGDNHPAIAALGIRLCADAGMRVQAVAIADAFLDQMSHEDVFPLDWPLPPPYAPFDQKAPVQSLGQLIYQGIVEFKLDRGAVSTFYYSDEMRSFENGLSNPEHSARFERSAVLCRARQDNPLRLSADAKLFFDAPDNLNYRLWRKIARDSNWLIVDGDKDWKQSSNDSSESGDDAQAVAEAMRLYNNGEPAFALAIAEKALAQHPVSGSFLNIAGLAARSLGEPAKAENFWRAGIAAEPANADIRANLGILLAEMKRLDEAEASYRQALEIQPDHTNAENSLGVLLMGTQRGDLAEAAFKHVLAVQPDHAGAWNNLGALLMETRRFEKAEEACRRALEISPDYAEAHNNLGLILLQTRRLAEAESAFRHALDLLPRHASAHMNLGVLLKESSRYAEAETAFRRALEILPDCGNAAGPAYYCARQLCDWSKRNEDELRLAAMVRRGISDISPFIFLSIDNPELGDMPLLQRRSAQLYATVRYPSPAGQTLVSKTHHPHRDRLRIGYLSCDFFEHATMYLLKGLLHAHDHSKFEIHAYSYGNADDRMTDEARKACEVFRDIGPLSDLAAAKLIAADGIDILVDLKGFTLGTRLGISALRPAPVMINWLGYPGTLGDSRLADYIIGDPVVTPLENAAHFSERIALMPHCYQPNDRDRVVGKRPSRVEAGLPEHGFVFCSFNGSYKITSETFDIWCRLLSAVPGSVLWLLEPAAEAVTNLRREAAMRNVDPNRLVFAPMKPLADHLGRLQLADLALDTYPVTSHTTASDALWVGVPMVTMIGNTFASRVAASLLHAMDMAELVTENWDDYYSAARNLAHSSQALAELRLKLAHKRTHTPLFDTTQFTCDLEQLYTDVWAQHVQSLNAIGVT